MGTCQSGQCGQHAQQDQAAQAAQEDQELRAQLKKIQHKLLVMSGKGGVGKSSVACYLALGLSKLGYQVGLLDIDLHGPSIPRMLGIKGMFQVNQELKRLIPHQPTANLKVVSIECLLEDRDAAVIWRGPVKHGVIKQFLAEVDWGELDYLVIDSPPGTGDEPLSIAQTIPDAHALIVTTPQEVALADVRKSIQFCHQVHMPILGLVENMSGLICPHCGEEIPLFGRDGGRKTSQRMNVFLLGSLPFDPTVVEAGDRGQLLQTVENGGAMGEALQQLVQKVADRCAPPDATATTEAAAAAPAQEEQAMTNQQAEMKFAIPLANGMLCNHFGHCEQFALIDVREGEIQGKELKTPPPHEPGVLPKWLSELGVNFIIAGGMGQRAISLFTENGVQVVTGAPPLDPESLVQQYLAGSLSTGPNVCDH